MRKKDEQSGDFKRQIWQKSQKQSTSLAQTPDRWIVFLNCNQFIAITQL